MGRSERAIEPVQTHEAEPTRATERLAKVGALKAPRKALPDGQAAVRAARAAGAATAAFEAAAAAEAAAEAAAAKLQALQRELDKAKAEAEAAATREKCCSVTA